MSFLGYATDSIESEFDNVEEIEKEVKNDCRLSVEYLTKDFKVIQKIEENPVWYFYDPPIRVKEVEDGSVRGDLKIDSNIYLKPNADDQLEYIKKKCLCNFKEFRSNREAIRKDSRNINLKNLKRKNVFEKVFSPSFVIHKFDDENHPRFVQRDLDLLEQSNYGDKKEIHNVVKKCKTIRDQMVTKRKIALETLEKILNSQIDTFETEILNPLELRLNSLRNVNDMEMKKKLEREEIHFNSSSSEFKQLIDLCVDSFSVILSFLSTKEILSGIYPTCSFFTNFVRKLPLDFKVSINQFNRFNMREYLKNFTIRKFQFGESEDNNSRLTEHSDDEIYILRRGQLLELLEDHVHQIRDLELNGLHNISFNIPRRNRTFDVEEERQKRREQNEEIFSIALKCPFLENLKTEFLPGVHNMSNHLKFLKRLEYSLKIPTIPMIQSWSRTYDHKSLASWRCLEQLKGYFESESRVHMRDLILHSFDSSFFTEKQPSEGILPFSLIRKLFDSIASSCPSLRAFQARIFVGFPCCSNEFFEYLSKVPKVQLFCLPQKFDIGSQNKTRFQNHYFLHFHHKLRRTNLFRTKRDDSQKRARAPRKALQIRRSRKDQPWTNVVEMKVKKKKKKEKKKKKKGGKFFQFYPLREEKTQRNDSSSETRKKSRGRDLKKGLLGFENVEYDEVSKYEKNGEFSKENVMKKIRSLGHFMSLNRSSLPESEDNYFLFVSPIPIVDASVKQIGSARKKRRKEAGIRVVHRKIQLHKMKKVKLLCKSSDDSSDESEDEEETVERKMISVSCMDESTFIYEVLRNVPYCRYSVFIGEDRKHRISTITTFTQHLQNTNNLISSGFYFVLFHSDQREYQSSDPYGDTGSEESLGNSLDKFLFEKRNVKSLHFFLNYEKRCFFEQTFQHQSEEEAESFDVENNVKSLHEMLETQLMCYMPQIILRKASENIEVTALEILKLQLVFKQNSMVRIEDLKSFFVNHVIPFLSCNRKEQTIDSNLKKFHLEIICEDLFASSTSKCHQFEKDETDRSNFGFGGRGISRGRVESRFFMRVRKLKGHEEEFERDVQLFFDSVKKVFDDECLCLEGERRNWEEFKVHFDLRFNQGKGRRRIKMEF